jgi:hypothetical protein
MEGSDMSGQAICSEVLQLLFAAQTPFTKDISPRCNLLLNLPHEDTEHVDWQVVIDQHDGETSTDLSLIRRAMRFHLILRIQHNQLGDSG